MVYLQLFWSFFQIGLFSIGGGLAALPLIQNQVVDIHGWLTLTQFTDLVTIAEMTPGPIAINASTFVGIQIAGIPGALVATFGNVLPSCIIVSTLAYLYFKYKEITVIQGILSGLRPVVIALIASAGMSILLLTFWGPDGFSWSLQDLDWIAVLLFASALFILRKFKPNPIVAILASGFVGGIIYYVK